MPKYIHLIFRDKNNEPEMLIGNMKRYCSQKIQKSIVEHPQESRKDWLIWMMERAALKVSNVNKRMLCQHHNKPIELWSQEVIMQKLNYIHQSPVKAGGVITAEHWKYSSADNYAGGKDMMKVLLLC